jgi:hypothetical protein
LPPEGSAALKGDALLAEHGAQALVADVVDHPLSHQELRQLGQAPGPETGRSYSAGRALAIFLISRRWAGVNLGRRPPLYFGYSELNPSALKLRITSQTSACRESRPRL